MCGISGFLTKKSFDYENSIRKMSATLHHRGPDDNKIWIDESGVALAHNRLSILDLSSSGSQPMLSKCGRYVVVFNGEIYNHKELRSDLEEIEKIEWNGHSDTETLVHIIAKYDIDYALSKISGMFAIAVWDSVENQLILARDRMGEKPLYYGFFQNSFLFGSELMSIKSFPNFSSEIDRNSLSLLLRYNAIPAPYSIYKDILKLEPGHYLTVDFESYQVSKNSYWSIEQVYEKSLTDRFKGDVNEAVEGLESVLKTSIKSQVDSDVPLGAFLSGGVDSSAIVALMQEDSNDSIKTFSIGFNHKEFNEAEHAREVAKYLGTEHFDMYVSDQDVLNVIPYLSKIYDEPFADSSQIPTFLVSKIAKQKVSVCLTGDAGDELFGGYNRYLFTSKMWKSIDKIPISARKSLSYILKSVPIKAWDVMFNPFVGGKYSNFGSKLHKGANVLPSKSIDELYLKLVSQVNSPEDWVINSNEYPTPLTDGISRFSQSSSIERMMMHDMIGYLPTDILTKVDRAAMSVSLETRVPFLDPKVIEFAMSLPIDFKIRKGVGKYVLREVLYKRVPQKLIDRPKMGFGVPLGEWLRGPLKEWAWALLDPYRLKREGYFHHNVILEKWEEHLSGKHDWHNQLWPVLMFQAWLENEK
jgi:asparagine synthase (glutamine-hydrolysing)